VIKLTKKEKETLLWMYRTAQYWKGGLDPRDFSEYDTWVKEAKDLITKLGVKISD
jgi:hypothetical protein